MWLVKMRTAYWMLFSAWTVQVCSSVLGCGRSRGLGLDMHFRDHEGLADVRAALFLEDSDELGLEAAVRGGIGELQYARHPVVEAFRCPVEEHQRRVAGDELAIGRVVGAARNGEQRGGNRHHHHLLLAGCRGDEAGRQGGVWG